MNKEQLIQNIDARNQEVAGYQTNIDNYSRMIAKISGEWNDATSQYRGMDTQAMASSIADDALLNTVADLNFRDKLQITLRSELLEQRKAKLVLEVLQDQLGEI